MLYDETDHEAAAAMHASIVAKAKRSDAARRKQTTGRTDDGLPVHNSAACSPISPPLAESRRQPPSMRNTS